MQELRAEEPVLQPAAVEVVDVHPRPEILDPHPLDRHSAPGPIWRTLWIGPGRPEDELATAPDAWALF